MLAEITRELDGWIVEENLRRRAEGGLALKRCEIRVFGQLALIEQGVPLVLAATHDVDVRATYEHPIEQKFRELLEARGKVLDPVAHEAWMPRETRYTPIFEGTFVTLFMAEPEAIVLSKALKAPVKNHALVVEYLARGASARFFQLAKKYKLDLEQFL